MTSRAVFRALSYCCFLPLILLASSCSHLFYHPSKKIYATPDQFQLKYRELHFKSRDETPLWAWLIETEAKPPKSTIVFFHGNAENLSSHFLYLAWLSEQGHQIFVFDYRGYGRSQGGPTQRGVYLDGLAALDQAWALHQKQQGQQLIVYGQSLGGAIAARSLVDWDHHKEVDLLVLDSTFDSYQSLAFDKLSSSWLFVLLSPLAYLLVSDEMAPRPHLSRLAPTPVLVIHGQKDQTVPYGFGKALYERLPNPKWLWTLPQGQHTDVFFRHQEQYRSRFTHFLKVRDTF